MSVRTVHSFIHSFIHFLYFPSILYTRYGKRHVHNTNSYRNVYLKKIKINKIFTAVSGIAVRILQICVININEKNKSFGD